MKIKEAAYLQGAVEKKQYPVNERPEIAFVGRSNVGKSSLLNKLLNRKRLAHTSSTPGKTRLINFYIVNDAFYLVDLPGYGFAKVPPQVKKQWQVMTEEYLTGRLPLRGIVMLVDLRHPPSKDDLAMLEWLRFYGYPTLIVATKADKISRSRQQQHLQVVTKVLALREDEPLITFSTMSGEGKEAVWRWIKSVYS